MTSAAATLDRSVIRWAEERMRRTAEAQATARQRRGDPAPLVQLRDKALQLAAVYGEGTAGVPSRFFPAPHRLEAGELMMTPAGEGPLGSRVTDLSFASSYLPFWSGIRESYLNYRENQRAHARWWRMASASPRPTLLLIHGWRAGAHWVSERVFEVPYWLRHGFDVVAFQLPFHGARAPEGGGSGELFLTRNLARTNEAFGHAIYDLRALAAALRDEHGVATLGALGMSLGGYTTALWSTVSDELDFAIAMIPAVAMHELMLRGDGARARRDGVDEALLAEAFAVHSPLARPPRLPPERLFVIAGHGDQITPASHAEALIAHWQSPSHWFAGGHLAQVGRRPAMRAARLHLREGGIRSD